MLQKPNKLMRQKSLYHSQRLNSCQSTISEELAFATRALSSQHSLGKYGKPCEVGCKPAPNRNDQTLRSSQCLHMARQRKTRPRMLIFEKRCSSVSQNTCPIHEKRKTKNSTGNVFCFYMYISRIPSPLRYPKLITELRLCLK